MQSLQNQFVTAVAVESLYIIHIFAPYIRIITGVVKLRLFERLRATLSFAKNYIFCFLFLLQSVEKL